MPDPKKQLARKIFDLLEARDKPALKKLLHKQRTSDIAEVVELIDSREKRIIFDVLDKPVAAEILEKVEEATRAELFELLTDHEIHSLISELDLDDAADLLAELPDEIRQKVLKSIAPPDSEEIRQLMRYSEDSAGGIMDPVLISVPAGATVTEAVNKIRAAEIDEDFYSVYVVNDTGKFLGDVRITGKGSKHLQQK